MLDRRQLLKLGGVGALSGAVGFGTYPLATAFAATAFAAEESFPDEILNPVEVTGAEAEPVVGKLPGARRMYMLSEGGGDHHLLGSMLMARMARPLETGGVYELTTFAGPTGSAMPRHAHLGSHVALVVMAGDIELELAGERWRMLRGDFANIPPGTAHSWRMNSDRGKLALFSMGVRVGEGYAAMGKPVASATVPSTTAEIDGNALARASFMGDIEPRPQLLVAGEAKRVSNLVLPTENAPYVLLDGGGERYGGNTFCAKHQNTGGQFLFIMSEGGGAGPGVGAHFHARHSEDFFGLDGEIACWAYGKALRLHSGDFFHAPPRHMHGFKMLQPYNRFVGFLTPGIFENFFTRGRPGRNGVGGRGAGEGAVAQTPPTSTQGAPPVRIDPADRFRSLSMSQRGPDGYPLDVHGPTKPLPPQDPLWTAGLQPGNEAARTALLQHANVLCGGSVLGRALLDPELRAAMALKPHAEQFI